MAKAMRRKIGSVAFLFTAAFLFPGCNTCRDMQGFDSDFYWGNKSRLRVSAPASGRDMTQPVIRSTTTLRQLLIPGMSTNEVVAKLGKPYWILNSGGDEESWQYGLPAFPADDQMQGSYVDGVLIRITNGHLAYWGCSYFAAPIGPSVRKEEIVFSGKGDRDSAILKFFVVSSNSIPNGRFIDTERFPKLGFISPTPSLTITNLKEVTLGERPITGQENQNHTVWAFRISLNQEDATRLKYMTTTNVLKQVLIMVGDKPVIAPTIDVPLETGTFAIECSDRSLMEAVKEQLAKIPRQGE